LNALREALRRAGKKEGAVVIIDRRRRERVLCSCLALAVLAAGSLAAQLDDSCMVSAFNRTTPVAADGTWVLPNVPADLGVVRVRATCLHSGSVQSGTSSLIQVPANDVIAVGDITFQNPVPIPATLSLTAATTQLAARGQTLQLVAQATYADGTTGDVTLATTGTNYRTSNPAIATVDGNGLVTAQASGVAIVSAVNEGALALLRLQVVLSGSSVGDGIPDDWKIAHGLDPNDPLVAYEDPDQDGLTNLEEYQYGTDPNNPDTDGDGLSDGDEVHVYHTNPLLWDTDGDGISDGVEVKTGSDPLDIHSFNLAAALSSITASPASFRLIFNTVDGQSSRQLQAVGNVIDGRTIDMFRPLYQTAVTSSDLTVASFGPEPGRVYAGQNGTATVTVGNSGHTASTSVTVQSFSPTALAYLPLPGFLNAVEVAGNTAYVAAGAAGLEVVDVSSLPGPRLVGSLLLPGNANDVRVAGTVAYVAGGDALVTVDVGDPTHPVRKAVLPIPGGNAVRLAIGGNLAYVADAAYGLRILDVGNPAQPQTVGALALPGAPRGVSLTGAEAVVALGDQGVAVVDVSNPAAPLLRGATPTLSPVAGGVAARGHLAYVAAGHPEGTYGGLHVVELVDPTTPADVGASFDGLGATRVVLEDHFALASQFFLADQAPIFDIGVVPPVYTAALDLSTAPGADARRGTDIAVRQGAVFVTANEALADFGSTGVGGLYTGLYRLPVDAGTNPPTVAITAPAPGASVKELVPLTVTADAHDEVAITSVAFLINGAVVDTAYKPPYQTTFAVPVGQATLHLTAVATSVSGALATAEETLAVVGNPGPVTTLIAPLPGASLIAGQSLLIAVSASGAAPVTRVEIYVNGQLLAATGTPAYAVYPTQPGMTSLAITAVAYDANGPGSPAGPVAVTLTPDQPPQVAVFAPGDGEKVVEGTGMLVVTGASSPAGIVSVHLFVNGTDSAFDLGAPFSFNVPAPAAGQSSQLYAVAYDKLGLSASSPAVTVTGIADPLTTITGSVVDPGGAAIAGATVTVTTGGGPQTATSAADGTFTVAAVPTAQGPISVTAAGTVGGCPATGNFAGLLTPVPGGITYLGGIVLASAPPPPPTTVTGTVLAPDGTPLAGAAVQIASGDLADVAAGVSDPGGSFSVSGFPARPWSLTALGSATTGGVQVTGRTSSAAPVPGGTTSLGSLRLQPPPSGTDPLTTVTGLVVAADHTTPVAGAQVVVDAGPFGLFTTTTGADGRFSVPGVPTLQASIAIAASQHQACVLDNSGRPVTVSPLTTGGTTDAGTLVLAPDSGPVIITI
jgi:hypothetical protein